MLKLARKFFFWLFFGVGLAVFSLSAFGLLAALYWGGSEAQLPDKFILVIDAAEGFSEKDADTGFLDMIRGDEQISTRMAVSAIQRAAHDDRVTAISLRADNAEGGLAQLQELRDAIAYFRGQGKKAYAFADTFGLESGGGNSYYLAASCDEIWMQPSGDWAMLGLLIEIPYLRGFLDKAGVKPNFTTREEYKTAMNFLTHDGFTKPDKDSMQDLAQEIHAQRLRAIAENRKLSAAQIENLMDAAPLSAGESLAAGLIDTMGYEQQLRLKLSGQEGKAVSLAHYASHFEEHVENATQIAVIPVTGEILRGRGDGIGMPFSSGIAAYADSIAKAVQDAVKDKSIRAIVLRVDSPGGSYVASDTIWQSVQSAKSESKPIYAVMGDTAASGGYFVAMAADKIFAQPGTMTGSIGVVAGKVSAAGLLDKLGVNIEQIKIGENADMWSGVEDFTPLGKARLERWMDFTYADFLQKVSLSRNLSLDQARAVAKGRVWMGSQAKDLGLVDHIGGWQELDKTIRLDLDIAQNDSIDYVSFPKPKDAISDALEKLSGLPIMARTIHVQMQKILSLALPQSLMNASSPPVRIH